MTVSDEESDRANPINRGDTPYFAMLEIIRKLFTLLNARQKRDFLILQVLMILTALTELIGVASILPFMALAADPGLVTSNEYLNKVYILTGEPDPGVFLVWSGAVFIFLIFLANGLLLVSQFFVNRYSHRLGGEFSVSIYDYYLRRDVIFHSRENSATLTQHVMRDSLRLSTHLISPVLRLNARIFSIFLLSSLIIFVDVRVAVITLVCFVLVYWFVFNSLRTRIYRNGKNISAYDATRYKMLNESFEGIVDIKLYGAESQLVKQFAASTRKVARSLADNMIMGQSPYYLVETLVLVGTLLITLYFMSIKGTIASVLPVLTLYVMAGFKLAPKIQQSYLAITQIRSAQPIFHSLYAVLKKASESLVLAEPSVDAMYPRQAIELRDVSYAFPGEESPVLKNVSLHVDVGSVVAITGQSGSGKSTMLDILMGLISPDKGGIYIDGGDMHRSQLRSWQRAVGFVPQFTYLSDTSIAENIAFGLPAEEIDLERVKIAARQAEIAEFIEGLPQRYDTRIGERGTLLSGGQRQRLGIARALYREISVLVLDEATSSLDNETQQQIFSNLKANETNLTIIMVTHREETLHYADHLYELQDGVLSRVSSA